jgi:hypothetical protein
MAEFDGALAAPGVQLVRIERLDLVGGELLHADRSQPRLEVDADRLLVALIRLVAHFVAGVLLQPVV